MLFVILEQYANILYTYSWKGFYVNILNILIKTM